MTNAEKWFDAISPLIGNLADRWEDEWRYESPGDYGKAIERATEKMGLPDFELVRMMPAKSRLLGCTVRIDGERYRLRANSSRISLKQEPRT